MLHLRMKDRCALAFGTLVLELLKTLNVIQKLQLFLPQVSVYNFTSYTLAKFSR